MRCWRGIVYECRSILMRGFTWGAAMLLEIEKMDRPRGFRVAGELDASNATTLSEAIDPEVARGGDLTLDLAGLAFMDSTGIQVLVRTAQGLEGRGNLILLSPGHVVKRILELIPAEKLEYLQDFRMESGTQKEEVDFTKLVDDSYRTNALEQADLPGACKNDPNAGGAR